MRKSAGVTWVMVLMAASAGLYAVKYRVLAMDEEISALNAQIDAERSSIHVLIAEWAYLTRPERLEKLAKKHLSMQPVGAMQLLEVADVPFPQNAPVEMVDEGDAAPVPSAPAVQENIIPAGGAGYVR